MKYSLDFFRRGEGIIIEDENGEYANRLLARVALKKREELIIRGCYTPEQIRKMVQEKQKLKDKQNENKQDD